MGRFHTPRSSVAPPLEDSPFSGLSPGLMPRKHAARPGSTPCSVRVVPARRLWLEEGVQGLLLAAVEQTFMILGESSDQPEAADDPPGLGTLEARRECPG